MRYYNGCLACVMFLFSRDFGRVCNILTASCRSEQERAHREKEEERRLARERVRDFATKQL